MTYINPRSKILWHTDRIRQLQRTGHTDAPINVEIDLSNRCSHGCSWCHFAHTHTRGPLASRDKPADMLNCGDVMDINLALSIIDQMVVSGVRSITWSGGGEPTLHPQFCDIVEYTGECMEQGLYTHGGHIDEQIADVIKRNMTFVYVSLDECTRSAFQISKGVDRFQNVLSGLTALSRVEGGATVGVGFLLHPGNVGDIGRMVDLAQKYNADYVQFRPIVRYEHDAPGKLAESTEWLDRAIAELELWHDDPFVYADVERFRMYQNWRGHGYERCNWAAMQTVITPNGRVWRCVNKRGHEGALIGDLRHDTFAAIWRQYGGACAVSGDCRLMCRGHIANITLDAVLTEPSHKNFV